MGTFSVAIQVGKQVSGDFVDIDALVDTGATYSLLPRDIADQLGIMAAGQRSFQLADDSIVNYDVGEARLRLQGDELTVLVVLAPEGTPPLLGATALELFGLAADPVNQRLIPVPALLKTLMCSETLHDTRAK